MLRLGFNTGVRALKTSQCRFFHNSVFLKATQEATNKDTFKPEDTGTEKQSKRQGLTADDPFTVASPTSKCIVGCSCDPQSHIINWFYVSEGEPQTCQCGYFFKLEKIDPKTTWVPEYSKIMYVDETRMDPRLQKQEGILGKLFSKAKKSAIPPASMNARTKADS